MRFTFSSRLISRCKAGEEEVKKCTPFSNTVCKKRELFPPTETTPALPVLTPAPPASIGNLNLKRCTCLV